MYFCLLCVYICIKLAQNNKCQQRFYCKILPEVNDYKAGQLTIKVNLRS